MSDSNILPEAQAHIAEADKTIQGCIDRITDSNLPERMWVVNYSQGKIEELVSQKREQAARQNGIDLRAVKDKGESLIRSLDEDLQKKLRPSSGISTTLDKLVAHAWEEQAYRVVRTLGVSDRLKSIVDEAMKQGKTDYATELIEWAELLQDREDIGEIETLADLKKQHIAALALQPILDSKVAVQKKLEEIQGRLNLLQAGYTYEWNQSKDLTEAGKMLKLMGVVS